LYVPALQHLSSPLSLAGIVALLRAPDGCPWDREQTHQSLRAALLEETYEVLEALDEQDTAKLCEELGDLMLLVLMQTQIAADAHEFTLTDVGAELAAKLIRRHPHVFGDVKVSGSQEVLANWRRLKAGERRGAGEQGGGGAGEGRVGVPRELPALARAQKVAEKMRVIEKTRGGRANRSGESSFPFQLPREIAAHIEQLERSPIRAERVGQVLFALAAWCEVNGIDAESALRAATSRAVEKIK
jgi:tetrapyrrole methylase family protein/MazG family protein